MENVKFLNLSELFKLTFVLALIASSISATLADVVVVDGMSDDGVEIERGLDDFRDITRNRSVDPDSVNTAMVFTNLGDRRAKTYCTAFNHEGAAIGRAWADLPPNGLRIILASDIAKGSDFIGKVHCHAVGRFAASEVVFGPGMTSAKARQSHDPDGPYSRVLFPLVASY